MLFAAIFLILLGAFMLVLSLRHAGYLSQHGERTAVGWRSLFLLVGGFLAGYLIFIYLLASSGVVSTSEMVVALIFCGGGAFVMLVVRLSVMTVRHLMDLARRERLHALHDSLTGLPNRILFNEQAVHAIQLAKRRQEKLAVMVMDLNRFKEINDTLGHQAGDKLLAEIAPRLQDCVRESDTVCRMGGDEFSILLHAAGGEEATIVARKIAERVRMPVTIEDHSLTVGISIGIAVYPEHGEETSELLRRADIAMYESKRTCAEYVVFTAEQDQDSIRRLMLITALREAIDREELALLYQPRIDVQSRRPCGVEALVRWLHPVMGSIPPDLFIPLAEQSGFMRPLTKWVLDSVLHQMVEWAAHGVELDVSVNISVRNLADRDFPDMVHDLLLATAVSPSRLIMEVTESSMISNPEATHDVLNRLAALGLRISIDDFGTGFSSLFYLKRLPASEVKVDKSFVMNMLESESDAVIVHATIAMAHNLGYKAVAEGVDNQEVLDMLEILGCDHAQGFHICKPVSPATLTRWLADYMHTESVEGRVGAPPHLAGGR